MPALPAYAFCLLPGAFCLLLTAHRSPPYTGLWQTRQSFEPAILPFKAGRAAIALSWQTLQLV